MSVAEIARQRGVEEVIHFTTNRGLAGILYSKAIKSRERLREEETLEFIFSPNADTRKDVAWLDYVNLSITGINSHFFEASERWHRPEDIWWCVLSLAPEVLTHEGVYFTTTNNIYTSVLRGVGPETFGSLFAERIVRWRNNVVTRDPASPLNYVTCEQAEVLYPGEVPVDFLKKIYLVSDEIADEVHGLVSVLGYKDIEIVVKPEVFCDVIG
jgi:hypothetical protein